MTVEVPNHFFEISHKISSQKKSVIVQDVGRVVYKQLENF